jgi:hypothetical protein
MATVKHINIVPYPFTIMKKVLLVFVVIALLGCMHVEQYEEESQPRDVPATDTYEATQDDVYQVFLEENITSMDVAVRGIMLNDSKQDVLDILGSPDNFTMFQEGSTTIQNFEYSLANDETGLIIHFRDDIVQRITVDRDFNNYLVGETRLNGTKEDLWLTMGVPDESAVMYRFKVYHYNDEGLEFYTFRGDERMLSFVPPSDTERNYTVNVEQYYMPYSGNMRLQ